MPARWMDACLDRVERALDDAQRSRATVPPNPEPPPVDIFIRDDDVGWGDDRLWPLLEIFADLALPVDLAVIPEELTEHEARGLLLHAAESPQPIRFHQHGFAHVNHEPTGRKYEFGPSRSRSLQTHDIVKGRTRTRELLGAAVDSIFTPPWNRCTEITAQCLVEQGFKVLSRQGRAAPLEIEGLAELPITVDWFAHHKGVRLSPAEFGALTATAIHDRRPVGIMFHHAVMDVEERAAARDLLDLISAHPAASLSTMAVLAGLRPAEGER